MIRFKSFSLIFSIAILFSAASISNGQGIREVLKRLDENNKSLQSLTADVMMEKFNPQLNVRDVTSGTTSYLPKTKSRSMYARIDWTKPVEEQMSVIGDNYELFRPRLNTVYVGSTKNTKTNGTAGNALAFVSMSKDQLKANYDITYGGEEQLSGSVGTWHLLLKPLTATTYKSAEIWVDTDGMPRQAKINEQNGDTTTVLLSNIKKNATIKASVFKLNYPSSVKKIKA